jgi:hypothetical protein
MINIKIIFFLLAGTLLFFLALRFQGKLETKETPFGIVSLELAHKSETIREILTAWQKEDMIPRAKANIWIDFFFIPFYSMLFYTLCGSISVRMLGFPAKLGVLLAFGSLLAGLFDVAENILMLFSLNDHHNNLTAFLTAFFAYAKFSLLILALAYVLPLGLRILILRIMGKQYPAQI